MATAINDSGASNDKKYEDLIYIRQILGELRVMADGHRAQMLCYLIDMAYQETSEMMQVEEKKSVRYS